MALGCPPGAEWVLDVKTANALGLTIPPSLLFQADAAAAGSTHEGLSAGRRCTSIGLRQDPRGLLRAIRQGLKPDESYLIQDINSVDKLQENVGPLSTVKFGFSVLYCMTTSLANGGKGLGTMGLPEPKLQELSTEAGFSSVRRIWENPFRVLYEVKP